MPFSLSLLSSSLPTSSACLQIKGLVESLATFCIFARSNQPLAWMAIPAKNKQWLADAIHREPSRNSCLANISTAAIR